MDEYKVVPSDPAGPLQPGQFRLCWLEISSSGKPQGRLAVFQVDNAPAYRALSYTWGYPYRLFTNDTRLEDVSLLPDQACSEEPSIEFICEGRSPDKIIPNLYVALLHLIRCKEFCNSWIWVDAICIRQHDLAEKATQIHMMARIFSLAAETIIWLGPELETTRSIVELARHVTTMFFRSEADFEDLLGDDYDTITPLEVEDLCESKFGIANIGEKMLYFFTFTKICRWFTRLWTVQEFVLAKSVRVLWGMVEIEWEDLGRLALFFAIVGRKRRSTDLMNRCGFMDSSGVLSRLSNLRKLRRDIPSIPVSWLPPIADGNDEERWIFHNFLATELLPGANYECTNPLDRIYAVLGRAEWRTGFRFASLIEPDYSLSCESLYTSIAGLIFEKSQTLDILAWTPTKSGPITNPTLPSWAFDYRFEAMHASIWSLQYPSDNMYDAAAGLPIRNHILKVSGKILRCRGVYFDTVRETDDLAYLTRILQFGRKLSPENHHGLPPLEVIWRSCIFDAHKNCTPHDDCPPRWLLKCSFLECVALGFVEEGLRMDEVAPPKWEHRRSEAEQHIIWYNLSKDPDCHGLFVLQKMDFYNTDGDLRRKAAIIARYWVVENSKTADGRPVFITERGLFGVGASWMQEGDQIWVLDGACTPYILRPTNVKDEFRVVGDCFILNHMHGEILGPRYGLAGTEWHIKLV